MDKEFKKIFDKLHGFESSAEKAGKLLENYQDYLDLQVEAGVIDEHEARLKFSMESLEVIATIRAGDDVDVCFDNEDDEDEIDEDDDDDAEDESSNCCHECCEKHAEEAVAETVSFFLKHQDIWTALNGLVNAMRDAGVNGVVSIDRSGESREADRS